MALNGIREGAIVRYICKRLAGIMDNVSTWITFYFVWHLEDQAHGEARKSVAFAESI
jgi:hypothetical protein